MALAVVFEWCGFSTSGTASHQIGEKKSPIIADRAAEAEEQDVKLVVFQARRL